MGERRRVEREVDQERIINVFVERIKTQKEADEQRCKVKREANEKQRKA